MYIVRVHHAQITIPKGAEAAARRFYCDLLGLAEVPKPHALRERGGFWLQAGEVQVHVGTEDGIERNKTKAHLAYLVSDLNSCRATLEAAGISVLHSVSIPGYHRLEVRDPFGNRIEFLEAVAEDR